MRFLGLFGAFVIGGMLSFSQDVVRGQSLAVLVLDALDGKPQANVEIDYFCAGPPSNSTLNRARTDSRGFANITTSCGQSQKIEIFAIPSDKKEQCGDDVAFTFNDIASVGFISKPDSAGGIWCPTKVSRTLKSVPGQVTMFVKKPTWWQSHVAG